MQQAGRRLITVLFFTAAAALVIQAVIPRSRIMHVSYKDRSFAFHFMQEEYYLEPGEIGKLRIFAVNKRITYHSSDMKVASVLPGGRIIAHREGRTVITAEAGGKKITCVVIVKRRVA